MIDQTEISISGHVWGVFAACVGLGGGEQVWVGWGKGWAGVGEGVHQGTTDLPIKPINRPILPNLPIIGITDHINPNIGSVSDRPIIMAHIG